MNAAVELHDSEVVAISRVAGAVVVRLSAYVHRSSGRPGIDPGSGWSQAVEFTFACGLVDTLPAELPCTLDDGDVSGSVEFVGMVPLPLSVRSLVLFKARGVHGEPVGIRGYGLEVSPVTEAVYVEEFPGSL